jgi:8-oxo-dGTP diphosphatase
MTKYVVGFMFSPEKHIVVLIRKNRPEWQAGKLNGIGGKIEPNEAPIDAMVREFREETGVETTTEDWRYAVGKITGPESEIFIYRAFSSKVWDIQTTTDEDVRRYFVEPVHPEAVSNLHAIIPALLLPSSPLIYLVYNNF